MIPLIFSSLDQVKNSAEDLFLKRFFLLFQTYWDWEYHINGGEITVFARFSLRGMFGGWSLALKHRKDILGNMSQHVLFQGGWEHHPIWFQFQWWAKSYVDICCFPVLEFPLKRTKRFKGGRVFIRSCTTGKTIGDLLKKSDCHEKNR